MNRRDLLKFAAAVGGLFALPGRAVGQIYPREFYTKGLVFPLQRMYCNRNSTYNLQTWGANTDGANTAVYMPFTIDEPFIFDRLFNIVGSGSNGNLDLGVYYPDYAKIVSTGSTAQSGAAGAMQAISLGKAYRLEPGSYWLGMAANNGSTTVLATQNSGVGNTNCIWAGLAAQTSAFPLPDPMVPIRPAGGKNYIFPFAGLMAQGW